MSIVPRGVIWLHLTHLFMSVHIGISSSYARTYKRTIQRNIRQRTYKIAKMSVYCVYYSTRLSSSTTFYLYEIHYKQYIYLYLCVTV